MRICRTCALGALLLWGIGYAVGDTILFTYEGDVPPADVAVPTFGCGNPCDADCFDYIEDGHYVAEFTYGYGGSNGTYGCAYTIPGSYPNSLFVEVRIRTNSVCAVADYADDARVSVNYGAISDALWVHGNAVFSFGVDWVLWGLSPQDFHVCRFESFDGQHFTWAIDGDVLVVDDTPFIFTLHNASFGGNGGNIWGMPGLKNEWDFFRVGLIAFGEVMVTADPPDAYIDPRQDRPPFEPAALQGLDRFTVTFDQPNGLTVDQVTVESTAPAAMKPNVKCITRPEGEDGGALLIILDKRIPPGHRTRFTISDEAQAAQQGQSGATNVVEYAFLPGDVNQDQTVSTFDVLVLVAAINGRATNLLYHDINRDGLVTNSDVLRLVQLLNGVQTSQTWLGYALPPWP